MYRCCNCRHVFPEPLTKQTAIGPVLGCPWCGVDDLAEVEECEDCGKYLEENDNYAGLCLDCLRQRIDYPTALSYLLARDYLRDFLATVDGSLAVCAGKGAILKAYLVHENDDRDRGDEDFLNKVRDFILEDSVCATDFALWLRGEGRE